MAIPESPTSVKTTVVPATEHTGVDHYVVQIKDHTDKNCTAPLTTSSCIITGLSPAVEYTVQAESCLAPSSGPDPCSDAKIGGKSWTKPSGKIGTALR